MINTLTENSQSARIDPQISEVCCKTTQPRAATRVLWCKVRSGVMFIIACIFSPCCAPLLVGVGLALLAGTPLAAWIGTNLGWVYGGLTLVSVLSLVLGIRWLRRPRA